MGWFSKPEWKKKLAEKERKVRRESYEKGRLDRARSQGYQAGRVSFGDRLASGTTNLVMGSPKKRSSGKKRKSTKRRSTGPAIGFGNNWGW